MSKPRNLSDIFFSTLEIQDPSMREQWRQAIRAGDILKVSKLLNASAVSANTATHVTGRHSLKTMALWDDRAARFIDQQTLAHMLMSKGVELRAPDKFGMYPADWCMLSGNRGLATIVVRETIRQFHEAGRKDYRPNVDPYFATCTDWKQRVRRFDNFEINHRVTGAALTNYRETLRAERNNGYEGYLSIEQSRYWERPLPRKLADMPYYSVPLMKARKAKTQFLEMAVTENVPEGQSAALEIERAHDDYYMAELRRLQDLRKTRQGIPENSRK